MLKLLLIRTGSTEYESQGRVQGTLNIPLNEEGRRQMEQIAEQLQNESIDAFYTGPCEAAQQSAQIFATRLDLKPKTLEKLINLDHGLWQGMLIQEVKAKQPKVYRQWQEHPETVCPPDGERLQDAQERAQKVLAKLLKKHKSGTIALVVPEPLTSLIRQMLCDRPLGDLWNAAVACEPHWEQISVPGELVKQ